MIPKIRDIPREGLCELCGKIKKVKCVDGWSVIALDVCEDCAKVVHDSFLKSVACQTEREGS